MVGPWAFLGAAGRVREGAERPNPEVWESMTQLSAPSLVSAGANHLCLFLSRALPGVTHAALFARERAPTPIRRAPIHDTSTTHSSTAHPSTAYPSMTHPLPSTAHTLPSMGTCLPAHSGTNRQSAFRLPTRACAAPVRNALCPFVPDWACTLL
ncbi:hypothetical protein BU17DRAFT_104324 [Hysterangium stoloniferum]|nr:hypothetical protein BU17DRAFT_104324 [Hysterangium stoloniferum]